MKTTRRSFLKYLSGLAVSAVAIPSFLKAEKVAPLQASDFTEYTSWFLPDRNSLVVREYITFEKIYAGDLVYYNGVEVRRINPKEEVPIIGIAMQDSANGKVNVCISGIMELKVG